MLHLFRYLLVLLALSLPWVALAQEDLGSVLAVTTERLLNAKPAGPYTVTLWGERFVDRAHLDLVITKGDAPIGADAEVRVVLQPKRSETPPRNVTDSLFDEEVLSSKGSGISADSGARVLPATFDEASGRYVTGPFTLPSAGSYTVRLEVQGKAGNSTTETVLRFFPQKPDPAQGFLAANVLAPILALVLLLGFYRWRGVALEPRTERA